jgi:hypothetical protein
MPMRLFSEADRVVEFGASELVIPGRRAVWGIETHAARGSAVSVRCATGSVAREIRGRGGTGIAGVS